MTSKLHIRDEKDFVAVAPTPPIKGRQLKLQEGSKKSSNSYIRLILLVVPIEFLQCFQIKLGTDQSVPLGITPASMEEFYEMENAMKKKIFDDVPANDAYGPRKGDHEPWVWTKDASEGIPVETNTSPDVWAQHSPDSGSGSTPKIATDDEDAGRPTGIAQDTVPKQHQHSSIRRRSRISRRRSLPRVSPAEFLALSASRPPMFWADQQYPGNQNNSQPVVGSSAAVTAAQRALGAHLNDLWGISSKSMSQWWKRRG